MSTFRVMIHNPISGSPHDEEPYVLQSGLSYEEAHCLATATEQDFQDHEADCDRCEIDEVDGDLICGPDCCKRGVPSVYVEEEVDPAFLAKARAM